MIKKNGLFSTEGMTESDRCLHTPSEFAKQNLLYVQEVGYLHSLKPHRCMREDIDSFLFLLVLEGKGNLDVHGVHYDLRAGDCALLDCMEHYEHISDENEAWKLAWVHFNGNASRGYYKLFIKCNSSKNVFHVADSTSWNALIGELLQKQKEKIFRSELHCGELLLRLLNQSIDSVSENSILEREEEKQIVNEMRELLNDQYADAKVLQTLEDTFGSDLKNLDAKFLKYYGIGIVEYISDRRFNTAKELLRFSIKPVEEIAKESGFGDIIAIQQMLYEKEGMTAEEYRSRWAAWIR